MARRGALRLRLHAGWLAQSPYDRRRALVPHLKHLWRTNARARELWAASATTVSDAWQYLQHHAQGTPLAPDLSPAKQAWLDAHLGLERTGPTSPLLAPDLNPTLAAFIDTDGETHRRTLFISINCSIEQKARK